MNINKPEILGKINIYSNNYSIYDPSKNEQNYLDLVNIKRGEWLCIRATCENKHQYLEHVPKHQCTRYLLTNTTYSKHKYNDKNNIKHHKTTIFNNNNLKIANRYGNQNIDKCQEFVQDNTTIKIYDKFIELNKNDGSASFIESVELDEKTVKLIFHF